MSKHTPGPFKTTQGASRQVGIIYGADGKYVARVDGYPVRTEAENEANLYLLAAAPALLEACREALSELERCQSAFIAYGHPADAAVSESYIEDLRAALALAEKGGE